MPLIKFKRGKVWYIRGTVTVSGRSQSIYQSSGVSDETQAEVIRARTENLLIEELLLGKKEVATFEAAMVSYGDSGGSDRFLGPVNNHFGKWRLREITQAELDRAARKLYPRAQPETRNRQVYTPFIAVWNHAVLNGWCEMRKWQRPRKAKGTNVESLKKSRAGTRPVDYERAAKFIAAMSPAPGMIMATLFYTGMRPIELFSLHTDDVSVPQRWITLNKSKIGEPRGIPIHEFLVPMFTALVQRGGALFLTHKGLPYTPKDDSGGQIKNAINGARHRLKRAGTPINDVSPYTGRHTVSTQLVINGVHPHIKDQILGHAVDDMSRHYTHVPQQPLIDAINTLPVPAQLRDLPWWGDPAGWGGKLVVGQGYRTDVENRA